MSTIKANNYEASTAGNNLIFKTNNAERMRIDTSGNLTLSSGSLSGTVQRGSYGSLSVSGSTNTYSGIDFTAASATFMIRTSDRLSGVYKDNNTWAYYIDGSGNYYSGGGLCPQTTAPPTLAAHLTRKDYVDANDIGAGQTWQDVKASRAVNTVYTNNTGKPIMVCVTCGSSQRLDPILVDSVTVGNIVSISTTTIPFSFIVPNGSTYQCGGANDTFAVWVELR